MNNFLITSELVKTIQGERLLHAQQRRQRSRRHVQSTGLPLQANRTATGPVTQFGGATERVLDTVSERGPSARAA